MSAFLSCTKCGAGLPAGTLNTTVPAACPHCGSRVRADVFPALFRRPEGQSGESLLTDSEAGCFFHPHKKAVVPCASCGRFLCSLCDVELGGNHICPACLEAGKSKRKIKNLETHRVLYDNIALSTAILPLIIFWFTIITAPASLYYSFRHWKSPTSILPRTKIRFIFAVLISVLQISGWAFFFRSLIK
jgi:hypothetical protein